MNEQENKEIVERFFEDVVTEGQVNLLDDLVADDFVDHEEFPGQEQRTQGPQAAREVAEEFRNAFPDLQVEVEQSMAEGDLVTTRTRWTGTHEGPLFGIEPTNETVEFTAIDIVRIEDGRAREHWGLTDNMSLFEQIGQSEPTSP